MEDGNGFNCQKTEGLPVLPVELIEDILSRLPVKTLLQFRCLSKSWRSVIDSKRFAKIHLEISKKNPSFAHHRFIVKCLDNPSLRHGSLQSLVSQEVTQLIAFDDPVCDLESPVWVVGCCNGLICILIDRKNFHLWNPSLRVSKKLPFIDNKLKHGCITKYGFGFDELTGDYKVYGILSVFWPSARFEAVGKVYSLKTNSWNRVTDGFGDAYGESGKLVNGKLHWGRNYGSCWELDIISFDLNSEEHGIVPPPSNLGGNFHPSLGELGGCLCMLCDYRNVRLNVWVMKQYGVQESWNKMVTIPYVSNPVGGSLSFVFYMRQSREILLRFASTFAIYSLKDYKVRYACVVSSDQFREQEVYVESLLQLVADAEDEGQA